MSSWQMTHNLQKVQSQANQRLTLLFYSSSHWMPYCRVLYHVPVGKYFDDFFLFLSPFFVFSLSLLFTFRPAPSFLVLYSSQSSHQLEKQTFNCLRHPPPVPPMCTYVNQFTNVNQCVPLWTNVNQCVPLWTNMYHYVVNQFTNLNHCDPMCAIMKQLLYLGEPMCINV